MHVLLTEDQELFRRTVREFAEREIAPVAAEHDETETFPDRERPQDGQAGPDGPDRPDRVRRRRGRPRVRAGDGGDRAGRCLPRRDPVGQHLARLRADRQVRHRRSEAATTCRRLPAATCSARSALASRSPAATPARCRRRPSATATTTSSTALRTGSPMAARPAYLVFAVDSTGRARPGRPRSWSSTGGSGSAAARRRRSSASGLRHDPGVPPGLPRPGRRPPRRGGRRLQDRDGVAGRRADRDRGAGARDRAGGVRRRARVRQGARRRSASRSPSSRDPVDARRHGRSGSTQRGC